MHESTSVGENAAAEARARTLSAVRRAIHRAVEVGWAILALKEIGTEQAQLAAAFTSEGALRRSRTSSPGLVDLLTPTQANHSERRSLSAQYGLGEFPLHTDGAYQPQPPRLVVLYCAHDQGGRPTRLFRWDDAEWTAERRSDFDREVFFFRNGRRSFVDTITAPSRHFVRFDAGCMLPATRGAARLLAEVRAQSDNWHMSTVDWEPGRTLVIDNWRVLHGRGPAAATGRRLLFRLQLDLPHETDDGV